MLLIGESSSAVLYDLLAIGENKRQAQAFTLAAVTLAIASTLLLLRISYVQAEFQTNMSKRNEGRAQTDQLIQLCVLGWQRLC